jgi:hypothetical protein
MNNCRLICSLTLALCLLSVRAEATIRVNEVLANEPGGTTSAEWFELFNDSPTTEVSLAFYVLTVDGVQVPLSSTPTIPPEEYLIVCKSESVIDVSYGNGSGTWGDDPVEKGLLVEAASGFSLVNSGGRVAAVLVTPPASDEVEWFEAGADGVSWERADFTSTGLFQSIDPLGATPGFFNSVASPASDLGVDSVAVSSIEGGSTILLGVTNRGSLPTSGGELALYAVNPADTSDHSAILGLYNLPDFRPGESLLLQLTVFLPDRYDTVGVDLPADDRLRNNGLTFVAVGGDYPPIVLNEFLPDPQDQYTVEWIELHNRSATAVDLLSWRIGDELSLSPVNGGASLLQPGDYLILAESVAGFMSDYPAFTGQVIAPEGWATLNNSGDVVRLVDPFGIEADRFEFASSFGGGITWSRDEDSETEEWGRSVEPGGTPGAFNEVRLSPSGSGLTLTVEPRIISRDGDGRAEEAVIAVDGPPDTRYTIRLYDKSGRRVRTFEESAEDLLPEYRWNGTDDGGVALPIGIYVLEVEAEGVESVRQTVVIAR